MYGIKFKHFYAIGARTNIEVLSPEACVQLKTQTNQYYYIITEGAEAPDLYVRRTYPLGRP